jgi:hypothetical protein
LAARRVRSKIDAALRAAKSGSSQSGVTGLPDLPAASSGL